MVVAMTCPTLGGLERAGVVMGVQHVEIIKEILGMKEKRSVEAREERRS
jgi:hypothetical protein